MGEAARMVPVTVPVGGVRPAAEYRQTHVEVVFNGPERELLARLKAGMAAQGPIVLKGDAYGMWGKALNPESGADVMRYILHLIGEQLAAGGKGK